MSTETILRVEDLKKFFSLGRKKTCKAVDGVTFEIKKGETLGLVGESGCGKSTLGRTLMRIYEPTSGKIEFKGQDSSTMTRNQKREICNEIQMIFQDPYASLNPRMTVGDIIAEGWDMRKKYSGAERKAQIIELLELVGLNEEHASRFPHEFSGGQRQRIGIARALSMNPEFIICDEPISALDVSIQAQIMNLLIDLQKERNLTYLFIAHDLSMVRYISDRIAVMYLGCIVEFGDAKDVSRSPKHPYTQALFSAAPVNNPKKERARKQILLKGDIPSPINMPPGCKFAPRCPYAQDICRKTEPGLNEVEEGRYVACHFVGKGKSFIMEEEK
jgi:oligopeptide transport system ATP-binding protein